MPTIVSQTVQVRRVCETLSPRKSFTIQKPASFKCDRNKDPHPMATTINATWFGVSSGCSASTGISNPDAVVIATVAEPVATRMNAESSQP